MRINNGVRLGRSNNGTRRTTDIAPGRSTLKILLFELAAILLQRGVTPPQFNALAKQAFIDAAANMSKFRNGRVNQSRVSVLTGLRRAEVRKLLSGTSSPMHCNDQHASPVETVIAGWCADKRYIDRHGDPKRLAITGPKPSFALLVKQYAGDVPHRAVLNELSRLRAVRQVGKHVEVKNLSALRQRQNFASFAYLMPAIVDGIRLASNTRVSSGPSSMRRVVLPAHDLVDLEMVRERCASSIETMLGGLSASLEPRRIASRGTTPRPHSCSVSVFLVENRGR